MSRTNFSFFKSHLDFAHHWWEQFLKPGSHVIDATCGNGRDTLKLAQLVLSEAKGQLFAFDKQLQAIENTQNYLSSLLPPNLLTKIEYYHGCHSLFPPHIRENSIDLIVYNLGYLPGGDKSITTETSSTLLSLKAAQKILKPGGAISLMCYPGHEEGKKELDLLLMYASGLSSQEWSCSHHQWINRRLSPTLLLLQKSLPNQLRVDSTA